MKFNGYINERCGPDPLDKILYERYFRDGPMLGTAVECGANDGLYFSTCKFFEDFGWNVLNIEASIQSYRHLILNRPKSNNLFCALSNKNNEEIHLKVSPYLNGCLNNSGASNGLDGKDYLDFIVYTARYDSLIQEPVTLFVLDVEGAEVDVIEGMSNTKYWPQYFCIEYCSCGMERIQKALGSRYKLDWHDSMDAVFIRKDA